MNTAYAEVINQSFSTGVHIPSIGQGILTPLQKPGKPKGPVKSIRPLMLLNGARKILSLIAHERICDKLDRYTGATQAAYKRGRSCADLIWTQRMLVSVVKNHHWEFSKMGVDMSAAFDTIVREYILETLELAGCCEDDIRIIRYLLSNTKLQVKINQMLSGVFESTLGSFQGDSISGILFTAMFTRAKKEAREEIRTREILGLMDEDDEEHATIEDVEDEKVEEETLSCDLNDNVQMPDEWAYADDGDYINKEMSVLESMYPTIKEILAKWNLFLNADKTEFTRFYLAEMNEKNNAGKSIRKLKEEEWRNTKALGSLMCSIKDIQRRCQLANVAFLSLDKCWLQGTKISLPIKIRLYDALVVSVMIYNGNSWSAPAHVIEKLDTTHRRHLRKILKIQWPKGRISNKNLYERCNTTKISDRIAKYRWTMLGHVLKGVVKIFIYLSMKFAIYMSETVVGRQSCHQMNLFQVIKKDLQPRGLYLNNLDDSNRLREVAFDRAQWRAKFLYTVPIGAECSNWC